MSQILRFRWVLIFLGFSLFASGCATTIPLNYSPSSILTASGSVAVTDFKYLPAINGTVAPNVIRNTAPGVALFDQDVAVFFRDAVFKELRFVGIKVDSKDKILTGEIQEFLIDDVGFSSVDWTLQVHYVVKSVKGNVALYECIKTTKKRTGNFAYPHAFGALNETIKLNIDELIKQQAFIEAIN